MDDNVRHKREVNPGKSANVLSKITFFFVFPIFRHSVQQHFKEDDVYELMNQFDSKKLGDKLENQWDVERKKQKPTVIRSICKAFGLEYVYWGLLTTVVDVIMMIAKPLLIGKVVAYFSPNQTKITRESVMTYAVLLIGCIFATIIFKHTYTFIMKQLCLRIKIATSTIIYRKILKLNTCVTTNVISGQVVTLITKDITAFEEAMARIHQLFTAIFEISVMAYMIYVQIGVSAFVGVSLILLFIAIEAFCGTKSLGYRLATAQKTDERLHMTQEILSAIRVIKMYTWELFFYNSIDRLRRKEIRNFQIVTYIKTFCMALGLLSSKIALYGCVITYVALGNHITAEKAFVVTACFTTMRPALQIFIPLSFVKLIEAKAAIIRINKYLLQDELADLRIVKEAGQDQIGVEMRNVTLSYSNETIVKHINLSLKPGLTLIIGAIGSGKSTILKAILGDVTTTGKIEIVGKVSYASQDPWLFPGTIRKNIIFNEPFNKTRYENVINACALQTDFDSFHFGDETLLSDNGLNLSKGQKIRINLARAVYKMADVYLLDDCLSAVDLKVGKHIFFRCIKGLLNDKLCIMVSHLHRYLNEADNIVVVSKASVNVYGNYSQLKESDPNIVSEHFEKNEEIASEDHVIQARSVEENTIKPNKNVYEENKEQGSVSKNVYYKYFLAGGIKLFVAVIVLAVIRQGLETWSDYFVRIWVDSEQTLSTIEEKYTSNSSEYFEAQASHNRIMNQYSVVIFGAAVFVMLFAFVFYIFAGRASVNLHRQLINKILNAAMPFFDKHLTGNIINRFSRDFSVVDEHLPFPISECIRVTLTMAAILVVVSSVNPWFLVPSVCFTLILYIGRHLYVPAGRNIRRIEGSTRSPVVGHMQATFDGITTIRASEAQKIIVQEFENHQNLYNSTLYMHIATVEAFSFYMDIFTAFYIGIIVFTLPFIGNSIGAGKVGLAITQSFALTGLLQWCVLQWSELEMHMTSAERVLEYTNAESEDKTGNAIEVWPKNGKIVYKDVSLRYSPDCELVLKNISFTAEAGEKIGIVGRTGAGKSSVVSVLFRLYSFDGTVTIDDVDINSLEVETVRSKISIMPQDPIIFSGTIRSNLDPKSQYTDKQLWSALEEVDMKSSIDSLDLIVKESSNNFSLGQKQLICLARIVLQNNSILVLDEATANVDVTTEALIQSTIRRTFSNSTIVTIAHRLHTVMDCDKILVIDAGIVLESGNPKHLLQNEQGIFYNMVKESGLLR